MAASDAELEPMTNGHDKIVTEDTAAEEPKGRCGGFSLRYAIEIPLIVVLFASSMGGLPVHNLIMYRTCVHSLNYSVELCRSFLEPHVINHTRELELEVQEYSMTVTMVRSVVDALGPSVLSLFMGAWADRHGRKPLLVWPSVGITVSGLLMAVYSLIDALGPWWVLLPGIPSMLTGSVMVMATGAMCTISDVIPKENRSFRLMLIHAGITIGTAGGGFASPYLVDAVGTMPLLFIKTACFAVGCLFTIVFIKESKKNVTPGSILTVFTWSRVIDIKDACFTRKPNNGRAIILLTVLASGLAIFTMYGSHGLGYMYTRTKIEWSMHDYTTFQAISSAMSFFGSIVGVGIIQRFLHISDLNFTAFAFFTCVLEYITKALATETWHMYLGSAIALFGSVPGPLVRSFLTKFVAGDDMAKVFGLMGSADSISPLVSPLIYSALYSATIATFTGAIMLLTAGVFAICFVLILIVQFLKWRGLKAAPVPL